MLHGAFVPDRLVLLCEFSISQQLTPASSRRNNYKRRRGPTKGFLPLLPCRMSGLALIVSALNMAFGGLSGPRVGSVHKAAEGRDLAVFESRYWMLVLDAAVSSRSWVFELH